MASVVDQSTSLGPDPIRPRRIGNSPLRNRRVVQLFQNLARNRIGQDDRRTKHRVKLFRSIGRSGHPEALIRTYRRNLVQRKVITGKFILIEQSVELRFRSRRETYITVSRFDLSTRYRGRTAAHPAMGRHTIHRTPHDLQRTRIGTRLFRRRNRQLTRRIPLVGKNLFFERRATSQQDCERQKVQIFHRHKVLQTACGGLSTFKYKKHNRRLQIFSHKNSRRNSRFDGKRIAIVRLFFRKPF